MRAECILALDHFYLAPVIDWSGSIFRKSVSESVSESVSQSVSKSVSLAVSLSVCVRHFITHIKSALVN